MIRIDPESVPEGLTPAELRVFKRMVLGETNKEIATAIYCSHRVVKFHASNIEKKLKLNRYKLLTRYGFIPRLIEIVQQQDAS